MIPKTYRFPSKFTSHAKNQDYPKWKEEWQPTDANTRMTEPLRAAVITVL